MKPRKSKTKQTPPPKNLGRVSDKTGPKTRTKRLTPSRIDATFTGLMDEIVVRAIPAASPATLVKRIQQKLAEKNRKGSVTSRKTTRTTP